MMQITLDTENLSDSDRAVLRALLGETTASAEAAGQAAKKTVKKAAAAPTPVPAPEPEVADSPTMDDAVARATELVSDGKAPKVKAALSDLGVDRVSKLADDQIGPFLAALA